LGGFISSVEKREEFASLALSGEGERLGGSTLLLWSEAGLVDLSLEESSRYFFSSLRASLCPSRIS